ncbi:hypothetical protein [Streptosporangium vulgare]|uniref:hypothetical protein n=1 Tax=Streptosporangium vulgare TaxID=46190 RepID=UPI0031D8E382
MLAPRLQNYGGEIGPAHLPVRGCRRLHPGRVRLLPEPPAGTEDAPEETGCRIRRRNIPVQPGAVRGRISLAARQRWRHGGCDVFLVARYGNEQFERVSASEVRGDAYATTTTSRRPRSSTWSRCSAREFDGAPAATEIQQW